MRVSGDKKSPRTSKVRDDAVRVRRFVRSRATEEREQALAEEYAWTRAFAPPRQRGTLSISGRDDCRASARERYAKVPSSHPTSKEHSFELCSCAVRVRRFVRSRATEERVQALAGEYAWKRAFAPPRQRGRMG